MASTIVDKRTGTEIPFTWNEDRTPNRSEIEQIIKKHYQGMARSIAKEEGIDPDLVLSVMSAESAHNPIAQSGKGASGLMQLMPETAREFGATDPNNPEQNLRAGSKYLKSLIERYKGDKDVALAAYNAGPTAVAKHEGVPPFKETEEYIGKVGSNYDELRGIGDVEDIPWNYSSEAQEPTFGFDPGPSAGLNSPDPNRLYGETEEQTASRQRAEGIESARGPRSLLMSAIEYAKPTETLQDAGDIATTIAPGGQFLRSLVDSDYRRRRMAQVGAGAGLLADATVEGAKETFGRAMEPGRTGPEVAAHMGLSAVPFLGPLASQNIDKMYSKGHVGRDPWGGAGAFLGASLDPALALKVGGLFAKGARSTRAIRGSLARRAASAEVAAPPRPAPMHIAEPPVPVESLGPVEPVQPSTIPPGGASPGLPPAGNRSLAQETVHRPASPPGRPIMPEDPVNVSGEGFSEVGQTPPPDVELPRPIEEPIRSPDEQLGPVDEVGKVDDDIDLSGILGEVEQRDPSIRGAQEADRYSDSTTTPMRTDPYFRVDDEGTRHIDLYEGKFDEEKIKSELADPQNMADSDILRTAARADIRQRIGPYIKEHNLGDGIHKIPSKVKTVYDLVEIRDGKVVAITGFAGGELRSTTKLAGRETKIPEFHRRIAYEHPRRDMILSHYGKYALHKKTPTAVEVKTALAHPEWFEGLKDPSGNPIDVQKGLEYISGGDDRVWWGEAQDILSETRKRAKDAGGSAEGVLAGRAREVSKDVGPTTEQSVLSRESEVRPGEVEPVDPRDLEAEIESDVSGVGDVDEPTGFEYFLDEEERVKREKRQLAAAGRAKRGPRRGDEGGGGKPPGTEDKSGGDGKGGKKQPAPHDISRESADKRVDIRGWMGKRAAAKIHGYAASEDFARLSKGGKESFYDFEANPTDPHYEGLREHLDQLHKEAKEAGVPLKGYQKDYLHKRYKEDVPIEDPAVRPEEAGETFGRRMHLRPGFTKKSQFKSYTEARDVGKLEPAYEHIPEMVEDYTQKVRTGIADREFFSRLRKDRMIAPSDKAPRGWVKLENFPISRIKKGRQTVHVSSWSAPREVAKVINEYMGARSKNMATWFANFNRTLKGWILSSGVPGTAFNTQGFKALLAHTMLSKNPVKGFFTGLNWIIRPKKAQAWLQRIIHRAADAIEHGVRLSAEEKTFLPGVQGAHDFSFTGRWKEFGSRWGETKSTHEKVKLFQEVMFDDPTYQALIPALKLQWYDEITKIGQKFGMDERAAKRRAAEVVNDKFGGLNNDWLFRQKADIDFMQMVLLAPDHYVSQARMSRDIAKALMNPKDPRGKIYLRVARNLMMVEATRQILSYLAHGESVLENEPGHTLSTDIGTLKDEKNKKRKTRYLKTYGTYMDVPRVLIDLARASYELDAEGVSRIVRNRLAVGTGSIANLLMNRDYRGAPIYGGKIPLKEQVGGFASEVSSMFLPQYGRALIDWATERVTPEEAAAEAVEAPLAYRTTGKTGSSRSRSGRRRESRSR